MQTVSSLVCLYIGNGVNAKTRKPNFLFFRSESLRRYFKIKNLNSHTKKLVYTYINIINISSWFKSPNHLFIAILDR